MGIAPISMSDGNPVSYLTHDIDYLGTGDANDHVATNRPISNLADRDVVLRDKTNEVVGAHNDAFEGALLVAGSDFGHATPKTTLELMMEAEHNADGTHKVAAIPGPVVIPVGHPYLNVTVAPGGDQELTAILGVVAGTLADAGDARFHSTAPNAANTDHDGRYYTESEIDILMLTAGYVTVGTGGKYATVTAALAAFATKILLISDVTEPAGFGLPWTTEIRGLKYSAGGQPNFKWDISGGSLAGLAAASGSIIRDLEIGNGGTNSNINFIGANYCIFRNIVVNIDGTTVANKISVVGDHNIFENIVEAAVTPCQTLLNVNGDHNTIRNVVGTSPSVIGTGNYHIKIGGSWNTVENLKATANIPIYLDTLTDSFVNNIDVAPSAGGFHGILLSSAARCVYNNIRGTEVLSSAGAAAHLMNFSDAVDVEIKNVRLINSIPPNPAQECGVISFGDSDQSRIKIRNVYGQRVQFCVSLIPTTTAATRNLLDLVINDVRIEDSDEATMGVQTHVIRCVATNPPNLYNSEFEGIKARRDMPHVARGFRFSLNESVSVAIRNCDIYGNRDCLDFIQAADSSGLFISKSRFKSVNASGIRIETALLMENTRLSDLDTFGNSFGVSFVPGAATGVVDGCLIANVGTTDGAAAPGGAGLLNFGLANAGSIMRNVTVKGCNASPGAGPLNFLTVNLTPTSLLKNVTLSGNNLSSATGVFLLIAAGGAVNKTQRISIVGNTIESGAAAALVTSAADLVANVNIIGNVYSTAAIDDGKAWPWVSANNLNA